MAEKETKRRITDLVFCPASGPASKRMLRLLRYIGTEPMISAVEPHLVLCDTTDLQAHGE
jgi:hypothetical protein